MLFKEHVSVVAQKETVSASKEERLSLGELFNAKLQSFFYHWNKVVPSWEDIAQTSQGYQTGLCYDLWSRVLNEN
jgi:hypothetical protein